MVNWKSKEKKSNEEYCKKKKRRWNIYNLSTSDECQCWKDVQMCTIHFLTNSPAHTHTHRNDDKHKKIVESIHILNTFEKITIPNRKIASNSIHSLVRYVVFDLQCRNCIVTLTTTELQRREKEREKNGRKNIEWKPFARIQIIYAKTKTKWDCRKSNGIQIQYNANIREAEKKKYQHQLLHHRHPSISMQCRQKHDEWKWKTMNKRSMKWKWRLIVVSVWVSSNKNGQSVDSCYSACLLIGIHQRTHAHKNANSNQKIEKTMALESVGHRERKQNTGRWMKGEKTL